MFGSVIDCEGDAAEGDWEGRVGCEEGVKVEVEVEEPGRVVEELGRVDVEEEEREEVDVDGCKRMSRIPQEPIRIRFCDVMRILVGSIMRIGWPRSCIFLIADASWVM